MFSFSDAKYAEFGEPGVVPNSMDSESFGFILYGPCKDICYAIPSVTSLMKMFCPRRHAKTFAMLCYPDRYFIDEDVLPTAASRAFKHNLIVYLQGC